MDHDTGARWYDWCSIQIELIKEGVVSWKLWWGLDACAWFSIKSIWTRSWHQRWSGNNKSTVHKFKMRCTFHVSITHLAILCQWLYRSSSWKLMRVVFRSVFNLFVITLSRRYSLGWYTCTINSIEIFKITVIISHPSLIFSGHNIIALLSTL